MKPNNITKKCLHCSDAFLAKGSEAKRGRAKFCCFSCYLSYKSENPKGVAERFWIHVRKDGPIPKHCPEIGKCWVWTASRNPNGYGTFSAKKFTHSRLAHRTAYELSVGKAPKGMSICHHCDNPACVRPSHLVLGTQMENVADSVKKGRNNIGEKNGAVKLRTEQVIHLLKDRTLYGRKNTENRVAAAIRLGTTERNIRNIICGRSWVHVFTAVSG